MVAQGSLNPKKSAAADKKLFEKFSMNCLSILLKVIEVFIVLV